MSSNDDFVARMNDLGRRMFADLVSTGRERTAAAAKRDPDKHAFTLVMADGKPASYRYCLPVTWRSKNIMVRWCYTCHRNAAGRFLAFRETLWHKSVKGANGRRYRRLEKGKRDQFRPFVNKSSARATAQAEANKLAVKAKARGATPRLPILEGIMNDFLNPNQG